MKILQSRQFERKVKKFTKQEKKSLDKQILEISDNPAVGSEKKGDLRGVYIHKFKICVTSAGVALCKDGEFYLNVSVRSDGGFEYRAEQKSQSVNACIDIIEEEIKAQIRRDTEKVRDLQRRGGRSIKKKMTVDESARF